MKIVEIDLLHEVKTPYDRISRYKSHFSEEKGDKIELLPELYCFRVSFAGGEVFFPISSARSWRIGSPKAPEPVKLPEPIPETKPEPLKPIKKAANGPRRS